MLELYITLVKNGKKAINQVPVKYREAVRLAIENENK